MPTNGVKFLWIKKNLYVCMQVKRVENKNNVYKQIEFLGVKGSER